MEKELSRHMLTCAGAFASARDLELSTLGRMAADDSRFFARLEDPLTTFTAKKYDAVMQWFSNNWPAGAPWPKKVPRPTPEPVA